MLVIMFPFLGGLASGALGLLGSSMNASAQSSINQQMIAMQEAVNAQNAAEWNTSNQENMAQTQWSNAFAQQNQQAQNWLALNGVQARVADAKAAGISPLAALGMQPMGGGTVAVGGGSPPAPSSGGVPSLTAASPGAGVASLGQDISRSLQAMQSPEDRQVATEKTRQDLEKGDLENELLKQQIMGSAASRHSATQVGPGLRNDPGVVKEVQVARGPDGGETSGPSRSIEGWSWMDPWTKSQWVWRNQIEPSFGYNIPKEVTPAAPGYSKYKNPITGRFYDFPSFKDLYNRLYQGSSTYTRQPGDISP